MPHQPAAARASRLQPAGEQPLAPFVRAGAVEDCSVYWAPVSHFPVHSLQRGWMLQFLRFLGEQCRVTGLREEWFLHFKALYPDLLSTFIDRSSRYVPVTGMTIAPGAKPKALPTYEEVKDSVERSSKSGAPVDVHQWMPDQTHWFAMKEAEAQRHDFFGHGGMFGLYLPEGRPAQALPKLPRFMTSHPSFTPDLQRQYDAMVAVQDGFLKQSKEMFGEPFLEDPIYRGLMFVLPLLTARAVLDAEPRERRRWFELAELWFLESPADKGMLLMCKDPEFDGKLISVLERTREDHGAYPL